ncbi:MAG TPA: hypothetical protein VFN09_00850 [Rhodanobacteraceae bacterium]|nr:hypothetical protein [Rhodanobacteraceae bacterium]
MSALVAVSPEGRLRRLRALGVQPYHLRRPSAGSAATATAASHADATAPVAIDCLLVLPQAAFDAAGLRRQVESLLGLVVGTPARLAWLSCEALANQDAVPASTAYLALGSAASRALGQAMPAAQREAATIVVCASTPTEWLAQPGLRRAAWHALRPLRRALRGSA